MGDLLTAPPRTKDLRRSNRFPVIVPVQAKWQEASGRSIVENAQAREVNVLRHTHAGNRAINILLEAIHVETDLLRVLDEERARHRPAASNTHSPGSRRSCRA